MGKIAIIIAIIKLITSIGSAPETKDFDAWPMPGYDSCNTSSASFGPKSADLELEWTFQVDGDIIGYTDMICAKNNIYFGNKDDKIYCVDAATGKLKWAYETFCKPYAAPCYYDNKIILICTPFFDIPNIICLDADTGKLIWGKRFNDRNINDFIVCNGRCYIFPFGEYLLCFDINSGETLWSYDREGMWSSNPVINDEKLYLSYIAGDAVKYKATVCLNAKNGQELWCNYDEGYFELVLAVDRLIGYDNTKIDCRSLADGKLLWSLNQEFASRICSYGSNVVLCLGKSSVKQIVCIDASNGEIKWKVEAYFKYNSLFKPILSNGIIYYTDRFYLYLIDLANGSTLKTIDLKSTQTERIDLHHASLVMTTNRIIVCTLDGKILCYKGK